jgi:hypothetical protein
VQKAPTILVKSLKFSVKRLLIVKSPEKTRKTAKSPYFTFKRPKIRYKSLPNRQEAPKLNENLFYF